MRTVKTILFLFLLVGILDAEMTEIYKNGEIRLIPDHIFGKNVDWDSEQFYKPTSFTIAKDGTLFAALSRRHEVYKFDKDGNFLLKFGQKGRGPADFEYPSRLSILDEKYLIVNEYDTNRRISIFDLEGNFVKLIRTRQSVENAIALRDNKIAISTYRASDKTIKSLIAIKNIAAGKEIEIISETDRIRVLQNASGLTMAASNLQNRLFARKTSGGNLLIGSSYNNTVSIYSPAGIKLQAIKLKIAPVKVDGNVVSRYREIMIKSVEARANMPEICLKQVRSASNEAIKKLFSENLPFYSNILLDCQDNILVLLFSFHGEKKYPIFQVYNPDGKYICDFKINFGKYEDVPVYQLGKRIRFHNGMLFAIVDQDTGEDVVTKIIKISLNKIKRQLASNQI